MFSLQVCVACLFSGRTSISSSLFGLWIAPDGQGLRALDGTSRVLAIEAGFVGKWHPWFSLSMEGR